MNLKKKIKVFTIFPEQDTMSCDSAYAFEELNAGVYKYILPFNQKKNLLEYNIVDILKTIILEQPDFIFSINANGLDYQGVVARAIAALNVPLAIWFIDNPFYFFESIDYLRELDNTVIMVWDRYYIPKLRPFFKEVLHLPQATNPHRFKTVNLNEQDRKIFSASLTFVGNLDTDKIDIFTKELRDRFPSLDETLLTTSTLKGIKLWQDDPSLDTATLVQIILNGQVLEEKARWLLERIVEYAISAFSRTQYVKSLIPAGLKIWGAPEWLRYIPRPSYLGRASYFTDTIKIFNASSVNLNISRVQQRNSTNQRVFDIPACRGFVISDFKSEMEEYFCIGKEMVCFQNVNDLQNKITYFLNNPGERSRIADKGFERVMREHTYTHRMERVIRAVEKRKTARMPGVMPIRPEYGEVYLSLGIAYEELKLFPQALEFYKKAVHSNPGYGRVVQTRLAKLG